MNRANFAVVEALLIFAACVMGFGPELRYPGIWKAYVFAFLIAWCFLWLLFPKAWFSRPWRFVAGFLFTLIFGTPSNLDPEVRSVRLSVIAAAKYAWELSR